MSGEFAERPFRRNRRGLLWLRDLPAGLV